MKKWLIITSLVLSMSCLNSANAVDPVTTGAMAAGAANAAAAAGGGAAAGAAATAAGVAGVGAAAAVGGAAVGGIGGFGTAELMNNTLFRDSTHGITSAKKIL